MKGRFKRGLDAEGIDHIVMTTHLWFIDRFTRTIENKVIWKGTTHKKKWRLLLPNVIKQYNNTIHDSTNLKPVDAIQDKNAIEVKTHLVLRSRFKIKYTEIDINDLNFLRQKQKYAEIKEHVKQLEW